LLWQHRMGYKAQACYLPARVQPSFSLTLSPTLELQGNTGDQTLPLANRRPPRQGSSAASRHSGGVCRPGLRAPDRPPARWIWLRRRPKVRECNQLCLLLRSAAARSAYRAGWTVPWATGPNCTMQSHCRGGLVARERYRLSPNLPNVPSSPILCVVPSCDHACPARIPAPAFPSVRQVRTTKATLSKKPRPCRHEIARGRARLPA
jgi:hypothetical protein